MDLEKKRILRIEFWRLVITICVPPMAEVFNSVVRRRRIRLCGIVQGVGFRPFVYNLAQHIGVGGFVLNSSSGLTVEVEGPTTMLDE